VNKPSQAEEVAQVLRGLVPCPSCMKGRTRLLDGGDCTPTYNKLLTIMSEEEKKIFKSMQCPGCQGKRFVSKEVSERINELRRKARSEDTSTYEV